MKHLHLLLWLVTVFSLSCYAQTPSYDAVYWGTYFNDSDEYPNFNFAGNELIDQIVVDTTGEEFVYVVGKIFSASPMSLPSCGGTQNLLIGSSCGYLAKYNRCGQLMWSTYIGDYVQCLALDQENGKTFIYVAGKAIVSANITQSAFACDEDPAPLFQPSWSDNKDAFIAKYADGITAPTLLRWTYFGGTGVGSSAGVDNIFGIDVCNNKVFVTGYTTSVNLHNGALHIANGAYGGGGDGFIAELDDALSTLKFFTYIGTQGNDRCHDIKIFRQNTGLLSVFVSGTTGSTTGIASTTGFDLTYNNNLDAFACKWDDNDGDGVFIQTWGTYIGGTGGEHSRAMKVDNSGDIFLTAFTKSTDLPVTSFSYDQLLGENGSASTCSDAFVIKIDNNGSNQWCSYFGGRKSELANGLSLFSYEGTQYVVIAGLTKGPSADFNLVNSIQSLLNGNDNDQYYDAFIAILNDETVTQQSLFYSTYLGGSNLEGVQTGASYHPNLAMGSGNALYFVTASKSNDIDQVVGSQFQHLIAPFNGGSDAFIAKLINSNFPNQSNCSSFSLAGPLDIQRTFNLSANPNPFHDMIVAELNTFYNDDGIIEAFNSIGQTVISEQIKLRKGANQIGVNLSEAPAGIYLLRITQHERTETIRLLKE